MKRRRLILQLYCTVSCSRETDAMPLPIKSVVSLVVTALSVCIVVRSKSVSRRLDVGRRDGTMAGRSLLALSDNSAVQSLVMFGVVTYFALFIYRHQKIAPPDSLFKFSLRARAVFLFALLFPYLGIGPLMTVVSSLAALNETNPWWWSCASDPPAFGYCVSPKRQQAAFAALRSTMTGVSIVLTSLSAYIVMFSRSVTRTYSNMLLISLGYYFPIVWVSVDVCAQFLGDPFFLFPTMCVFRRSSTATQQITATTGFAIVQSIIMLGIVTNFALFIYRHQTITPAGSLFKFSMHTRIIFLVLVLVPYFGIGPLFYSACAPIAKFFRQFSINPWEAIDRERVEFYSIVLHTFAQIRKARNLSPTMQRLHRILTRSLIFQALTPLFFIIIPIAIASITQYASTRPHALEHRYPIIPFDIAVVLFAFHVTIHSFVLIGTTPAFRHKIVELIALLHSHRISPEQHAFEGQSAYVSFTSGASSVAPRDN
ncbi:hypothetical protein PRIPAC_80054 [Pristionchus pacificus]|uniref:G protein-coupled receptor n=1 Tax=Pristionchus pacificus TaxID=54126 RepID=A0A2A6BX34_PRIPA|nr:hypothetical protein PRIPAC_80054 [Pristionchus pacificus]|eukprot:PDM70438.1 G protein-coupled receptor [Pristionchus pacificus]